MKYDIKKVKIPFCFENEWKDKVSLYTINSFKFTFNSEGKKILFISNKLLKSCVSDCSVLDQNSLYMFSKMLEEVNNTSPFKEALIIPYTYCSFNGIGNKLRNDLELSYKKHISKIVKKYKPDLIVSLGAKLKGFNLEYGEFSTFKDIPYLYTLSIIDMANNGGDEGRTCCAGFVINQLKCWLSNLRFKIDVTNYKSIYIDTLDKFDKFYSKLILCKTPCIDTETVNLNRVANRLLSIQIYLGDKEVYFLPYKHRETPWSSEDIKYINKKLKRWFERGITDYIIYHNAKFDEIQLREALKFDYNNHLPYDTQAGEFALDENRKFLSSFGLGPYGLGQLALEYGSRAYKEGDITKDARDKMEQFSLKQIMEYGNKDVIIPYYICRYQRKKAKLFGDLNFVNTVVQQIGVMIRVFEEMEYNGVYVDKKQTLNQMAKTSVFNSLMKKVNEDFKNSKYAKEANKLLLKQKQLPTDGGLWGGDPVWLFDIGKEEPKELLYFKVMDLEPLELKANGYGKCDKYFQVEYKDIPEVSLLSKYNKIKKLKSSYIDATFRRFSYDDDLKKDGRLRCKYGFTGVVTGRASCSEPNQQQIPSHSSDEDSALMVNAIRRQFICSPTDDYIQLHADYSAHEVRNWGNVARDPNVCKAFRHALDLQREIRIADYEGKDTEELLKRFETEGDVHKQNYKFFFGKWPETKEQRSSVKSVVFGIIYGKGARALAEDIKDSIEQAKKLMNLMFTKFDKGGKWLRTVQNVASKTYKAIYPNGRIRHLWGYLSPDESLHASMDRKGPNSVIQGFSSDCNFTGGYNLQKLCWDYFGQHKVFLGLRHENVVHDSIEAECPLANVPIALYLMEHAYTTLIHKRYREYFNFEFMVDLVMEFDLGASSGDAYTWNFLYENFYTLIKKTLKWKKENLNIMYDKNNYKAMKHNFEIISKLRYKELKASLKYTDKGSEVFLLPTVVNKLWPYDVKTKKILKGDWC